VVPARDPGALASAIDGLLQDEAARADLSERGRQRILQHFSWNRAAEQLTTLYRGLIR
jgi:glycosyltransferase involved in cell wall biosynthesis